MTPADDDEVQAPSDAPDEDVRQEDSSASETGAPDADESPTGEDTGEEKPRRGGLERRFAELTAQVREGREERDRLLALIEQQMGTAAEATTTEPPSREQFTDYETFLEAKAAFAAEQRFAELQKGQAREQQERQQKQAADAVARTWELQRQAAMEQHDDYSRYEDVVGTRINANPAVVDAIMTSDLGTEIVRYLGQHPKDLERITEMKGARAVVALGRIEERLEGATGTTPSAAPTPARRVRGTTTGAGSDPLSDKSSTDAWMKARMKQVRSSR